ncbi:MAG TPA: hypothetical protein VGL84_01885 [Gaiellaceae bacterium]
MLSAAQAVGFPVSTAYKIQNFPTFYILDKTDQIVWRNDGEQPDALLHQVLLQATRTH